MPSATPWTSASSARSQPVYAPPMVRFMVLYQPPADAEAFEKPSFGFHGPPPKRPPGLRRYPASRNPSDVRGPDSYYMVAELDWDDMDSLRQDFASPLGKEIAGDVHKLAEWCPAIRSMIFELE